ncbi:helix-turn-helix domain-containing protein [Ascidiaceihabitans sp.]|uniref:GlxA family transcriptional regulator n=1 Tax=Ascidiaceihabitans sp. TaxID=1872644 RepID=UPI00329974DC
MGRPETNFDSVAQMKPVFGDSTRQCAFEIFVTPGFAEAEVSSVITTLRTANSVLAQPLFSWTCVSDTPGYVRSRGGMIVDASPCIDDAVSAETMIVVGGEVEQNHVWPRKMRLMQRRMLTVVLLSEAATNYIRQTNPSGKVTTHWREAAKLEETGCYPALSTRFSEKSNGVITAAGGGASTSELIIGLIAPFLTSEQVAELGNRLLLGAIRQSDAEQPKHIAHNTSLFDAQITQVLRKMEDSVADPLPMSALADEIGISTRQLERSFKASLNETPAKFYKRLRAKRARVMIEETLLPLVEIAVATGFGSNNTLSKAIKDEYGLTPSKMRARKSVQLLRFEAA